LKKQVCTAQEQLNIFNPYQNGQEQKEHGSFKTLLVQNGLKCKKKLKNTHPNFRLIRLV
jgi:hypothetical protein